MQEGLETPGVVGYIRRSTTAFTNKDEFSYETQRSNLQVEGILPVPATCNDLRELRVFPVDAREEAEYTKPHKHQEELVFNSDSGFHVSL
ncbi:uncharacterized protein LOC131629939 isoform X2 [Vicia villosa]|uniref:uncharacterized protein LOC131629939 isoform X2 n=1 Tax=Vicia villosa TaxID=3911 RepID=UPI00273B6C00|nr:uncharacterized protein LOC131629939 isoform X2 [Vicia villosa]